MRLGQLIDRLGEESPDKPVRHGFSTPHSWRGIYAELAFEPEVDTTVGAMLKAAKSAVGKTFNGYKGGEYEYDEHTTVHLAYWGDVGVGTSEGEFSIDTLEQMLGREPSWDGWPRPCDGCGEMVRGYHWCQSLGEEVSA